MNRYLKHHKIIRYTTITNIVYILHFICASRGGDVPKMYGDITR